jgi:hypothetical protein
VTSSRSEIPPKPVALFALHALVLALLLGWWPTPRALYPGWLHAQGNALFGSQGVVLRPAPPERYEARDSLMEGFDPDAQDPRWRVRFDAIDIGYWPSAVLLALLLATPLSARRRLLGVIAGLVWIDALALGRLAVEVLHATAEVESGAPGAGRAEGMLLLLRTSSEVLNSNIVTIAALLLAWVAVASPRQALELGGLQRLLGLTGRRGS